MPMPPYVNSSTWRAASRGIRLQ